MKKIIIIAMGIIAYTNSQAQSVNNNSREDYAKQIEAQKIQQQEIAKSDPNYQAYLQEQKRLQEKKDAEIKAIQAKATAEAKRASLAKLKANQEKDQAIANRNSKQSIENKKVYVAEARNQLINKATHSGTGGRR